MLAMWFSGVFGSCMPQMPWFLYGWIPCSITNISVYCMLVLVAFVGGLGFKFDLHVFLHHSDSVCRTCSWIHSRALFRLTEILRFAVRALEWQALGSIDRLISAYHGRELFGQPNQFDLPNLGLEGNQALWSDRPEDSGLPNQCLGLSQAYF